MELAKESIEVPGKIITKRKVSKLALKVGGAVILELIVTLIIKVVE